jgi:hypothetical protein
MYQDKLIQHRQLQRGKWVQIGASTHHAMGTELEPMLAVSGQSIYRLASGKCKNTICKMEDVVYSNVTSKKGSCLCSSVTSDRGTEKGYIKYNISLF